MLAESAAGGAQAGGAGVETGQRQSLVVCGLLGGAGRNAKRALMIEGYVDDLLLPNAPRITILV